jgi:hypothetical protein
MGGGNHNVCDALTSCVEFTILGVKLDQNADLGVLQQEPDLETELEEELHVVLADTLRSERAVVVHSLCAAVTRPTVVNVGACPKRPTLFAALNRHGAIHQFTFWHSTRIHAAGQVKRMQDVWCAHPNDRELKVELGGIRISIKKEVAVDDHGFDQDHKKIGSYVRDTI